MDAFQQLLAAQQSQNPSHGSNIIGALLGCNMVNSNGLFSDVPGFLGKNIGGILPSMLGEDRKGQAGLVRLLNSIHEGFQKASQGIQIGGGTPFGGAPDSQIAALQGTGSFEMSAPVIGGPQISGGMDVGHDISAPTSFASQVSASRGGGMGIG